jgi:hypothetical protein
MLNKIVTVFFIIFIFVSSVCADEITCEAGNCNGWYISYNKVNDRMIFKFENNTGSDAFRITCRINFYDMGGNHLGNVVYRVDGPIHKEINFASKYPVHTYSLGAEIYYKKEY